MLEQVQGNVAVAHVRGSLQGCFKIAGLPFKRHLEQFGVGPQHGFDGLKVVMSGHDKSFAGCCVNHGL